MGGAGMEERDETPMGTGPRYSVDKDEALLLEAVKFGRNIVHRERQVMQTLSAFREEAGHGALGPRGCHEFHVDASRLEERHAHVLAGDLVHVVERETEGAVPVDRGLEILDRNPDVVGRADQSSPRAL